jgi:hypothetical protein
MMLRDAFCTVLPKVRLMFSKHLGGADIFQSTQVSETKEFVKSLHKYLADPEQLSQVTLTVKCYRGDQKNPRWMDTETGIFLLVYHCRLTYKVK